MKGGDHGFARRRARRQPPRARPLLPVKKSLIRHLRTWLWAAAMILAQPEGWAAAPALARGRRGAAWGPGLAISTGPGGLGGTGPLHPLPRDAASAADWPGAPPPQGLSAPWRAWDPPGCRTCPTC